MAQDPWEVLGINPTFDERAIKRAYAQLVRKHPPEGDADAFQLVRAAFEQAIEPARLWNATIAKMKHKGEELDRKGRSAVVLDPPPSLVFFCNRCGSEMFESFDTPVGGVPRLGQRCKRCDHFFPDRSR